MLAFKLDCSPQAWPACPPVCPLGSCYPPHLLVSCTHDCTILPALPNQSEKSCEEELYFSFPLVLLCTCCGLWCGLMVPFAKQSDHTFFGCQMLLISLWSLSEMFFPVVFCGQKLSEGEMVPMWEATLFSRAMFFKVVREGTCSSPKDATDVYPSWFLVGVSWLLL